MTAHTSKYRIISKLSDHSDSVVWLAEHKVLKIKRIIKGIRKTSPYYISLVKEAHLLKKFKYPFIPEIFDLEEDDDYTYIIEQYIEGESLKSLCDRHLLTEKQIFRFIIQLGQIIDYLHSCEKAVVYLDIKPENIMVSEDTCYLVDFGSAYFTDDKQEVCFGTRSYASPEQINGEKITKSSDIYSLGILLGYMIDHGNVFPNTEKALRKLIERMSSKKKWNRIGSAKRVIARINEIQNKSIEFSEKPVKIAFTGTSCNMGVTYLSLCFAVYIKSLGRKCTYAEANKTEAWYALSGDSNSIRALAGLETVSRKTYEKGISGDLDIIADFGCLEQDMPEQFYDSDMVCIVTGNRIWEIEEIIKARALSHKCRNIMFLINYTEDISESTAVAIDKKSYIAIPYIKDFETIKTNKEVRAVLHELAVMTGIIML